MVVAYGLILPKPVLDAPPLGCFNIHASLLPRWRGAAPINRAIMAGDAESGVTIMQMDEGLDTGADGDGRARCAIGADMTAGELHDALARLGADLMPRALAALERGTLTLTPQPADGRHLCRQDRQGRDPHRLDEAGRRRCTTISAGCRRFPAPGSRRAAARIKVLRSTLGRGAGHARHACSTIGSPLPAATARCGLSQVQRAGKQPMKARTSCAARRCKAGGQVPEPLIAVRRGSSARCGAGESFDEFGEVVVGDPYQVAVPETFGIVDHGDDLRREPQRRHRVRVGRGMILRSG